MKLLSFTAGAMALTALPAFANDYTFGDELLAWVNTQAETRSTELAKSDFRLRTINLRIRTLEQAYAEFDQITGRLDRINREIQTSETALKAAGPLRAAILREASADQHLVELMRIHHELDSMSALISALVEVPKRSNFVRLGLVHVGRASVVSSFMGMKAAADSLPAQYGAGGTLDVDTNGRITDYDFSFQVTDSEIEEPLDGIVGAFAKKYPKLAVAYGLLKMAVLSHQLREYQKQREKVQQAVALLPEKLISADAQFQIYSDASVQAQAQFADNFKALEEASDKLRASVKQLFSLSVARANVARQSLNQSKLDLIAAQYAQGLLRDAIDERTLITTFQELRTYHAHLAAREIAFLEGCGDTKGIAAAEDWQDGLAEAKALYAEIATEGRLAPLQDALTIMQGQIDPILSDSATEMQAISTVACTSDADALIKQRAAQPQLQLSLSVPDDLHELANQELPAVAASTGVATIAKKSIKSTFGAGFGTCLMMRQGVTYYCDVTGAGGVGHYTQFPGNGFSPWRDVLASSGDGGYRPVVREYQAVTADADRDLRNRTQTMNNEVAALTAALPDWTQHNLAAAAIATTQLDNQLQDVTSRFTSYSVSLGQEFDQLQSQLQQYILAPADLGQMGALAGEFGGSDLALRNVPDDQIMPDSPQITGIGAWDRVYAQTDLGAKELMRELRKHEIDRVAVLARFANLAAQGQSDPVFPDEDAMLASLNMTMTTLAYAQAFASPAPEVVDFLGVANVERLRDAHLKDAQQRRYHARGLLDYKAPGNLDGIGWAQIRPLVIDEVNSFMACSEANPEQEKTLCNQFLHNSMQHIYNIDDFAPDTSRGYPHWKDANEMIEFMEKSDKWRTVGNAGKQADLDRAGQLASQGRAVVATWANEGGHGHVAIILPGPPTGRSSLTKWRNLLLPDVANFSKGNLEYSRAEIKITYAFGSKHPQDVIIYVRDYDN